MKNPHPDTAMTTHYKITEADDNDDDISYFSAGRRTECHANKDDE